MIYKTKTYRPTSEILMRMSAATPAVQSPESQNVHSLELFFDLVFVFTVSQLSRLVAHPHGWQAYLQAALIFIGVAWIYSAFVWLTNNLRLQDSVLERWNLLLGMFCFFGMAVGIPHLIAGKGALFALSMLAAVVLHYLTFSRVPNFSTNYYAQIAPYSLATALLVLFAAFAPAPWNGWLVSVAVVTLVFPVVQNVPEGPSLHFRPRHFVERHGLMLIIALGEGVLALGNGASTLGFSFGLLGYAALGLMILSVLWWIYFGMNQHAAEHRLQQAGPDTNRRLASNFNVAHTPVLAGTILIAASLEVGVHHPLGHAASATAWNMAAGLSLFCVGVILIRRRLSLPIHPPLLVGGALCLLTGLIGTAFGAFWQLLAALVILLGIGFSRMPDHADS